MRGTCVVPSHSLHLQEEDILFAKMVEAGFPGDTGPIAHMLRDHNAGRALVQAMVAAIDAAPCAEAWGADGAARRAAAAASVAFAKLLMAHMDREDHRLYPLAASGLSSAALREVDAACAERGPGAASLVAIGEHLAGKYGSHVAPEFLAPAPFTACGCGCSHEKEAKPEGAGHSHGGHHHGHAHAH